CISITTSGKKKKYFTLRRCACGALAHPLSDAHSLSRRHGFASARERSGIARRESSNCKNARQMAVPVVDECDVPASMRPRRTFLAARKCAARSAGFTIQKKFERILPESVLRTVAGRRIGRIGPRDSQSPVLVRSARPLKRVG